MGERTGHNMKKKKKKPRSKQPEGHTKYNQDQNEGQW